MEVDSLVAESTPVDLGETTKQMKSEGASCVVVATQKKSLASLYLFYDNTSHRKSEWYYSLYKIDIDSTATTTDTEEHLSPVLKFPWEENPTVGMKCAQLGSKFYFLGGTKEKDDGDLLHPRDVYSFDVVTGKFNKMDVRLNAGKPKPCVVFAANGKLYALSRIPYCCDIPPSERSLFLSKCKLFECFDPATSKWQVLDTLPPVNVGRNWAKQSVYIGGIHWIGCTVLEKRQQVVLIGRVFPQCGYVVKLVYHLEQGDWTCERLPMETPNDVWMPLGFQEATDDDYLYGLPRKAGPPLKSKSDFLTGLDEINLNIGIPVDGVIDMAILDKTKEEGYKWFFNQRSLYSSYWYKQLLRYIGNGHFCYIGSGMLPDPNIKLCCRHGCRTWDSYSLGINCTLFEEIKGEDEEKLTFQARILHSRRYVIRTPFINLGNLEGCFVVTAEQLQRKKNKKKAKKKMKKKNIHSFGSTSG